MKRSTFALVAFLLVATPAQAEFSDGVEAYNRGDYKTAFREWKLSAEQGDVDAQFNIAGMYQEGQGVPQDYAEAVKWYQKAAEQGAFRAQFNLGVFYANGLGVPQNSVLAHMWFYLAASDRTGTVRELALENLGDITSIMTPEQLTEAQRLARNWKPKESGGDE